MKNPLLRPAHKLSLALVLASLSAVFPAGAGTEHWTGAGADSNWTTSANWSGITPPQTYFNDVDFTDFGGSPTNSTAVNNFFVGSSGIAQCPIYMLRMYPTNRNFTTMIAPNEAIYTGAGTGDLYVGADTVTASRGAPNLQETISFQGAGALLAITGTLHVGQGLGTNTNNTVPPSTQYVTLNMSGLDNFVMMTNIASGTKIQGVTISNTAAGTAATRFLLCGQITPFTQGAIYLAKTNLISLGNDMEIGAISVYSNSLPCPVYLGIYNSISVGGNGASSGLVTVGSRGCTNGSLTFNPAFLGGPTPPVVSFASPANINSGRVTTFYVCRSDGGVIPAFGYADFTGGNVSAMVSTLQLGYASNYSATGVLTYDNGVFNVNTVNVGIQNMSAGGAGIGTINLNTNSTYATNATLTVNGTLTLGAVTGTLTPGTSGTLNINGGTLNATNVISGGGTATVNMTNANWYVSVLNPASTNMIISALNGGGATNIINITAITPLLGSAYPVRFHLISASSITGNATFGLGSLPASYQPSNPYEGYIDATSTPGLVDLVLTSGPNAARIITWTGLDAGVADGNWDVAMTPDWATNGTATIYNQDDFVIFNDVTAPAATNVTLTTTITPYVTTVSNNASLYTFGGSGNLSGFGSLSKQGTGTLVLDNSVANNFTGGVTVSGGTLQIGSNDSGGSLPAGTVTDNATLAYDQAGAVTVNNVIAGSGSVVQEGGGTLHLAVNNTFSGNAVATNSSTLQGGVANSFGTGGGQVVVANGSTLDPNGSGTTKTIAVSGAGVSGTGAIVNSGGPIYDSGGGLTPNLTLTGNTTLSYPTRWDLGGASANTATLSTGGQPYNLTLNGSGYFEWRNVQSDAQLANMYLANGTWGIVGSTTMGNPLAFMVISNGTEVNIYNGTVNATLNKQFEVQDGALLVNAGGANTISGLVLSNVNGSQYCTVQVGAGTTLTVSSNITGDGILDMENAAGTLILNGNGSTFAGGANIAIGVFDVNGAFGSGITNYAGTILEGTANCTGYVDVGAYGTGASFYPGGSNAVGTFTAAGLTLESGANVYMDLKSTTATGGSNNDLVVVNGNLNVNNNKIYINPVAGTLANGTYTLMTFTGTVSGSFGAVQTLAPSRYTLTLNVAANQVQLTVTGNPNNLVWNDANGNNAWDTEQTYNWTNLTKGIEDQFYASDAVTFNDIAPATATNVTIASGTTVFPSVITNSSSTLSYTIGGGGSIGGGASLVKTGTAKLTITGTNSFTGGAVIGAGLLKTGNNNSLGATGSIVVSNGATLDLDYSLLTQPLVIAGTGVNGAGALVDNDPSGASIFDSGNGGLQNITLTANATIGGTNRVDLGKVYPGNGTVSSGGNNYSLTMVTSNYREWANVVFDANFGDINVMTTNSQLGIKGTTSLGNPVNTLRIFSNATVQLYNDTTTGGTNVTLNKTIQINGGATLQNAGGTNLLLGPVNLGSSSSDNCTINVGGTSLTMSNAITGSGNLTKSGSSPLILTTNNTYTGNTVLSAGTIDLVGNASIADSAIIALASSTTLDVSGRTDKTFNLASSQSLGGTGKINGNLVTAAGSTLSPGASGSGTLTVTNIVTLQGTTAMTVGTGFNNQLSGATIAYGGTLSLTVSGTLTGTNTFKLFNSTAASPSYTGSFSSITPATPGPGLAWNTSQLNTSGTLAISLARTTLAISVSGTNLTLTGSGGAPTNSYQVLSATNVTGPWVTNSSGTFNGSGGFTVSTNINTNTSARYFILKP